MAELSSCDGPISGEHLISKSVIEVLAAEGNFSISGVPWLAPDETKFVGPNSLTANCLCKRHNSALSDLDDAAQQFFTAIKAALHMEAASSMFVISGHDLERWLLKTAKTMAVSGNLTLTRQRLSGSFPESVDVISLLDDPLHWPPGAGLYCVMETGARIENDLRFRLWPFVGERGELFGVGVTILGLEFALMLQQPNYDRNPHFRRAKWRPGKITIDHPSGTNVIHLSWEDGQQHRNALEVRFLRAAE